MCGSVCVHVHVYMCMYMNICTYTCNKCVIENPIHLLYLWHKMYHNSTALQGKSSFFAVMEWKFTDYIAAKMQRKFIKEAEIWECFSLAMFSHTFRGIQVCETLHLLKSACSCITVASLWIYWINSFWFWFWFLSSWSLPYICRMGTSRPGALLPTWVNFNPSMDK